MRAKISEKNMERISQIESLIRSLFPHWTGRSYVGFRTHDTRKVGEPPSAVVTAQLTFDAIDLDTE